MNGKLMTQEEYLAEEAKETEIELSQDEWDIDAMTFFEEEQITEKDLATSPVLKVIYNRFISATNWIRWCLL